MSLDFPAFGQALWALYDSSGIRPEYALPVLYSESGFSTSVTNSIGCVGIGQSCPFANNLPADYASWSASQQLSGMVGPAWKADIAKFGPIRSGTRLYQANFLPATLATAKSLSSVLAAKGGNVYLANAGLDYTHKGAITVSDLAHFISLASGHAAVKDAVAQAYALRPGESPKDPVYGDDFLRGFFGGRKLPWLDVALIAGAVVGLGGAGYIVATNRARRT